MLRVIMLIAIVSCSAMGQVESLICAYQRILSSFEVSRYPYEIGMSNSHLFVGDQNCISSYEYNVQAGEFLQLDTLCGFRSPFEFDFAGSYAYVASLDTGFQIVDISDPGSMYVVGSIDLPGRESGVVVHGTIAYVRSGGNVYVVDVTNPASPFVISELNDIQTILDHEVVGQFLCIALFSSLEVYDISDPSNPEFRGELQAGLLIESMYKSENGELFVSLNSLGGQELLRVGLSEAGQPVETGRWSGEPHGFGKIRVEDGQLLSRPIDHRYLKKYELGEEGQIDYLGQWYVGTPSYDFEVVDGKLLYGLGDQVVVYESVDPPVGSVLSSLPSFDDEIEDQVLDGDLLYAVSHGRVMVIDVSDPESIFIRSEFSEVFFSAGHLSKIGDFIVFTLGGGSLRVIDVSNPDQLEAVSENIYEGDILGMVAVGDVLYIAGGSDGLVMYDLSEPSLPIRLGELDLGGTVKQVSSVGETGLVAIVANRKIVTIDLADPVKPLVVGSVQFEHDLYYLDHDQGLLAVMSTDRVDLLVLNQQEQWEVVSGVNIRDTGVVNVDYPYVFVSGIQVIDASDLEEPEIVAEYLSDPRAVHASRRGEFVVMGLNNPHTSEYSGGIQVLDLTSSCGACDADLNTDGALNFYDISAFLVEFQAQSPIADWNSDGAWNFFDVSGFLESYIAGCP